MIAICLPSRGLVFTQTMQSVFDGMSKLASIGIASKLFTSHNLPIPDSHHFVVSQALQEPVKRIIMVEEDHYIFPDTFVELATTDKPILTVQYNDKNGSPHGIVHYNTNGEILWAGLGATSISREVFEKIGQPYFRTDHLYKVTKKQSKEDGKLVVEYEELPPRQVWNESKLDFEEVRDTYVYGGLDVDFYTRAAKSGYRASLLNNHKAVHFELVSLGQKHTNNGTHIIQTV